MDRALQIIKRFIPKKLFHMAWPLYHFLLGVTANIVYRWPSQKLIVIGVTGTTGKTTTTYLIASMLRGAGYKVGYTSTAMFSDGNSDWINDKKMTMVGRLFTHKMLRKMLKNGCQYAVIETSSEGIVQYRHRFIDYDVVLITGLYPEHIESHGSFDNYREAKGMLFSRLKDCKTKYTDDNKKVHKVEGIKKLSLNRVKKTTIVNANDQYASYFASFWAEEKFAFNLRNEKVPGLFEESVNRVVADISQTDTERKLIINKTPITVNMLGRFNLTNILAAATVGLTQGISLDKIRVGLEQVSGVPGRLEKIDEGQSFSIIVDYAFEPNAVKRLYETINESKHGKIIHVLGSTGGGRDKSRRPILGAIAGEMADIVIVTDEDPYDENPSLIIEAVAQGAESAGKKRNFNLFTELSRREAINKALKLAKDNDVVLITGKGSEQAICRAKGKKEKWDDRKVCREELSIVSKAVDN
ncbi:MAG: UDP-N-acetylmuramyl-tripeptide synthetase [Candidatus Falkowbacteria bacterium]|nr:UDP-N-acetylmuramyl-tripeptide synthetase [Candidatus Falkowbacteria bacterium]